MSTLKRLQQQSLANDTSTSLADSVLPASKRLKSSHTPQKNNDVYDAIIGQKSGDRKLNAVVTNGIANTSASKVNDTRATIGTTVNGSVEKYAISISSDAGSDDEEEDEVVLTNGAANGIQDTEMTNGHDEEEGDMSFGDMLKARHPEMIDVHASLPDPHAEPPHLIPASGSGALIKPVTGHSLATVLQQALKTNDKEMLESCFHLRDLQAVRNTIQRLPSPLVGNLLSRIAERIYKRPGRTGNLMLWIQWSLVAHGGYLATQPDVLKKLRALNQVIRQRAQGLQPLVQLKGKLDMLSAQLDLRRGILNERQNADAAVDEEDVLYIEGKDDEGNWNEDITARIEAKVPVKTPIEESEDANDFNPEQHVEDQSEEEDVEEAGDDILDIEAEETSDDDDDDEEDEDDDTSDSDEEEIDEENESEDDSEPEVKAPKLQTLNRKR